MIAVRFIINQQQSTILTYVTVTANIFYKLVILYSTCFRVLSGKKYCENSFNFKWNMEEDNVEQLRSNHSVERVCVKFVNLTNRVVEVIWVNYSGLFQRYTLLRKRQHVDINTFKTHPWIAVDVDTKDR